MSRRASLSPMSRDAARAGRTHAALNERGAPPTARRTPARRKRQGEVRHGVAEPRASFEELEIRTSDGASLRALVDDPPEGQAIRGTLVLAHAMFTRKTSFGQRDRPGLSHALA